ncbi:MAG: hypothetical protein ACT4PL_10440 [Phycisphaerales bacterium]
MIRRTVLACASLLPAALAAHAGDTSPPTATTPPGLVVHEWGTFTNFQGSDGVKRRFRTAIGDDLPSFVRGPGGTHAASSFVKESVYALHRMETPVIYFYAPAPASVSVRVDFPHGEITEIYPPATEFSSQRSQKPLEDRLFSGTSLRWEGLTVAPAGESNQPPEIKSKTHYAAARATESLNVTATTPTGPHHEKFLFYRGAGDFETQATLRALGGGRFEFESVSSDATGAVMLIDITGSSVRFSAAGPTKGKSVLALGAEVTTLDKVTGEVEKHLTAAGLFAPEARAMVNTWKDLWFGEQGTRVLYILPESLVNTLLPLNVSPAPREVKRVFVGRMDVLTPEREGELEGTYREHEAGRPSTFLKTLQTYGRFSEPVLQRLKAMKDLRAARQ